MNLVARTLRGTLQRLVMNSGPGPHELPQIRPQFEHLWSIGIYGGASPLTLEPIPDVRNPVLTHNDVTDICALMVADPFMLKVQGHWYMFFEVWNRATGKGEIGLAVSHDGLAWTYRQIVLSEPYHLSYPYVFEWKGDYYMIPETFQPEEVRLYTARRFPYDWVQTDVLLRGDKFSDSSIFRWDDLWWIFTAPNPDCKHDMLRLYYSSELRGPWHEHPSSPIVENDPHIARPGGRVLVFPDRIIRFTQDCYPLYGTHVRAFEITTLTTSTYEERPASQTALLGPNGAGWNAGGMHHVDAHQLDDGRWRACVDGWICVESLLTVSRKR